MAHYATPQQAAFSARAPVVRFVTPNLGPGASGPVGAAAAVRAQRAPLRRAAERRLRRRHRPRAGRLPQDDRARPRALRRHARCSSRLAHGGGVFHVRYRGDGRHVEADLTRQVLAEIEPGGHVHAPLHDELGQALDADGDRALPRLLEDARASTARGWSTPTTSSAATRSTATPKCRRTPPATAACACRSRTRRRSSRGCTNGTPVDVYNESGGGSSRVRGNAGP